MEVTFKNGNTATKAISISLSDNGKFLASFSDYKIKKTDKFVRRSNDNPINSTYIDKKGSAKLHGKKYQFIVNVSKEGIVQNPDRMIILKKNRKGIWKVTNEGY